MSEHNNNHHGRPDEYPDREDRPPHRNRDNDRERPRRGGRGRGGRKGDGRNGKRGDDQQPPLAEKPKEEKRAFFNSKKPVLITEEGEKVVVALDSKFKVKKELNEPEQISHPPIVAPMATETHAEKHNDHGPRGPPAWDRKDKHEKIELTRPKADSAIFKNTKMDQTKPVYKEKEFPEISKPNKFIANLDYVKKEPDHNAIETHAERTSNKQLQHSQNDQTDIQTNESISSQQFAREHRPQNQNRNTLYNKRPSNENPNFEAKFKKGGQPKHSPNEYETVSYQKKIETTEDTQYSKKNVSERPQNSNVNYQPKKETDPFPKESVKREQNPKNSANEPKDFKNSGLSGEQSDAKKNTGGNRFNQKKANTDGKGLKSGQQNFEPAPATNDAKKSGNRQLDPAILVNSKRNSKDQPKTFFSSNVFQMLQQNDE